jgi:hypothetical protein
VSTVLVSLGPAGGEEVGDVHLEKELSIKGFVYSKIRARHLF